jgi:hypothetical protein
MAGNFLLIAAELLVGWRRTRWAESGVFLEGLELEGLVFPTDFPTFSPPPPQP